MTLGEQLKAKTQEKRDADNAAAAAEQAARTAERDRRDAQQFCAGEQAAKNSLIDQLTLAAEKKETSLDIDLGEDEAFKKGYQAVALELLTGVQFRFYERNTYDEGSNSYDGGGNGQYTYGREYRLLVWWEGNEPARKPDSNPPSRY